MAIIYTYPVKANPAANDLILISDSADSNKTKQIKISSLPSSGAGISLTTTGTSGAATLNGTILNIPNYATGGTPSLPLNGVQYRDNNGNFAAASSLIFESNNGKLIVGDAANDIYGTIEIQSDNDSGAELKIQGGGSYYTTIRGSQLDTASYNITLPVAGPGGNDKILQSNSSGDLSWIDTPSGGVSHGFSPLPVSLCDKDLNIDTDYNYYYLTIAEVDMTLGNLTLWGKSTGETGTVEFAVYRYPWGTGALMGTSTLTGAIYGPNNKNIIEASPGSLAVTAGESIIVAIRRTAGTWNTISDNGNNDAMYGMIDETGSAFPSTAPTAGGGITASGKRFALTLWES